MKNFRRYIDEGGEGIVYALLSSFFVFFVSSNYLVGGIYLVFALILTLLCIRALDKKNLAYRKESERNAFLVLYFEGIRGGNSPEESFEFASGGAKDARIGTFLECSDDPSRFGICADAFSRSVRGKGKLACTEVLSELKREKENLEEEERKRKKWGQELLTSLFVSFLFFLLKLFFSKTLFASSGDGFSLFFALVSLLPLLTYFYLSSKGEKKHGRA